MNINQSRLENLPNEILFEVFKYFDARELYQAFHNHNSRFDALLQSINEHYLILSIDDNNHNFDNEPFSPSIHTLIVNENANVIPGHFRNVHRLILHWLHPNLFQKLELDIFPHLEYLSYHPRQLSIEPTSFDLAYKIFKNGFPQLKVCLLPDMMIKSDSIIKYYSSQWINTPTINVLKIGRIDLLIYKNILSVCPTLRIFEFAISPSKEISTGIEHHLNMKNLVIKPVFCDYSILEMCLLCVPNVQRLDIYLKPYHLRDANVWSESHWLRPISNWLKSKIDSHLLNLRRMNLYLSFDSSMRWHLQDGYILHELERSFEGIQTNRYKTRLIIDYNQFFDF